MSVTLRCRGLRMQYDGQNAFAVGSEDRGVDFEVAEGELFALLGPSGCGKTTTLKIVGGFVKPTDGTVEIDGRDVTREPPYRRPTNTVFQSYALFPHKDVAANVEFGLKIKRVGREERRRRVSDALTLVGLGDYGSRRISELSGGQAQRAALARALVNRPAVLLLDEPLGALDLKLRRQMQDELASVKRETRTSFVHVTHDQEEACAIADRIAVMQDGHIVQVASPLELYQSPRTTYVAEFINAGTVVRGAARRHGDVVELRHDQFAVSAPAPMHLNESRPLAAVLPPSRVSLTRVAETGRADEVVGVIERVVFTGAVFDCSLRVRGGLLMRASIAPSDLGLLGGLPEPGDEVLAKWDPQDVIFVEDAGLTGAYNPSATLDSEGVVDVQ